MNRTPTTESLRAALQRRRLYRYDVARILGVSLATASRYLSDPLLLNGYQRRALAELLKVAEVELTRMLTGPGYELRTVDKKHDTRGTRRERARTFDPDNATA